VDVPFSRSNNSIDRRKASLFLGKQLIIFGRRTGTLQSCFFWWWLFSHSGGKGWFPKIEGSFYHQSLSIIPWHPSTHDKDRIELWIVLYPAFYFNMPVKGFLIFFYAFLKSATIISPRQPQQMWLPWIRYKEFVVIRWYGAIGPVCTEIRNRFHRTLGAEPFTMRFSALLSHDHHDLFVILVRHSPWWDAPEAVAERLGLIGLGLFDAIRPFDLATQDDAIGVGF